MRGNKELRELVALVDGNPSAPAAQEWAEVQALVNRLAAAAADGQEVRLSHPDGGTVVIELPMSADTAGKMMSCAGKLGFDFDPDKRQLAIRAEEAEHDFREGPRDGPGKVSAQ